MNENINYAQSINDALHGSMDAFEFLYKNTLPTFKKTVMKYTTNPEDIDDILQEAYVKIFTNFDSLRNINSFIPWGINICKNEAANYVTSKSAMKNDYVTMPDTTDEEGQPSLDDVPANTYDSEFNPEASIDSAETKRLMDEMITALPENQRLVITMWQDGYTQTEIADKLQANTNTIKSYFYRGKKAIESKVLALEKQGTKLYGMAPFTFFLWVMHGFDTSYTPDITPELSGSALSNVVSKMPNETINVANSTRDSIAKYGTRPMKQEAGLPINASTQDPYARVLQDNTDAPDVAAVSNKSAKKLASGFGVGKIVGIVAAVIVVVVATFVGYSYVSYNNGTAGSVATSFVERFLPGVASARYAELYEGNWFLTSEAKDDDDYYNWIELNIHDIERTSDGNINGQFDVYHELLDASLEFSLNRDNRKDIMFSSTNNVTTVTYSVGSEQQDVYYNDLTLTFDEEGLNSGNLLLYKDDNGEKNEYYELEFESEKVEDFPTEPQYSTELLSASSDYSDFECIAGQTAPYSFKNSETYYSYNYDETKKIPLIESFDFSSIPTGFISSVSFDWNYDGSKDDICMIVDPKESPREFDEERPYNTTNYNLADIQWISINEDDTGGTPIAFPNNSGDLITYDVSITRGGTILLEWYYCDSSNRGQFDEYALWCMTARKGEVLLHENSYLCDNSDPPSSHRAVFENLKPDEMIKNTDPDEYDEQVEFVDSFKLLGLNKSTINEQESTSISSENPDVIPIARIETTVDENGNHYMTFIDTFSKYVSNK